MARPRTLVSGDSSEVVHSLSELVDLMCLHAVLAEGFSLFFIIVQPSERLTKCAIYG